MDVKKYLLRIGFEGPTEPSLDVLRSLHECHLHAVPFENLTFHSGGRVRLHRQLFYDKIVNRRRGGCCCENNGLFSWLLSELGYNVTILSGQVKNLITAYYGPPFDHLILMVTIEGRRWLCDVGFGVPGFFYPLSLETDDPQEQGHRLYRIRNDGNMRFLEWQQEENKGVNGDWKQVYKFTMTPRNLEDFTETCNYHQRSSCSLLFSKSLCTFLIPGGRLTYIGRKLITTKFPTEGRGTSVETTTRELTDEEIPVVLAEMFGVVLNSPLIPKDNTVTIPSVIY